jgi:hypothetical protein
MRVSYFAEAALVVSIFSGARCEAIQGPDISALPAGPLIPTA